MADNEQYDTPSVPEVQQGEAPGEIPPVRVEVVNVQRSDHMPTEIEEFGNRTVTLNASARQILGYNPRRCSVQVWAFAEDVILGRNQAECENGVGPIISGGLAIPYRWSFCNELWAKTAPGATADATLNIVTEMWSR